MTLIYHRALDRTVEVPEQTVPIWQRSGWKPVEHATESPADPAVDPPSDEEDTPNPPEED